MAVTSTVTMEDDILAVTYSPDGKLLAVALLDTTIKIFFTDSMKFFLSLYGGSNCVCICLCVCMCVMYICMCTHLCSICV